MKYKKDKAPLPYMGAMTAAQQAAQSILPQEQQVIDFAYASIVSIKPIKVGDVFSIDNIWVKRPGNGKLLANNYDKIIGMEAKNDINMNEQISPENIVGYKDQ